MIEEILKQCTVEGMVVKLPPEQLDRKVYTDVKKKLELIGGKWKGGKTMGFVFEEDPTDLLAAVAGGEQKNLKKEFQCFFTPPALAKKMAAKLANVISDTDKVLEPSAGSGNLIKAVIEEFNIESVDCFEILEINRKRLANVKGAHIMGNDFIEAVNGDVMNLNNIILGQYQYIIANPPFTNNQDVDHIHAMYKCLKPGGTLVTMASTSWVRGSQKKQEEFKQWLNKVDAIQEEIPAETFKESGTMVASMLLTIEKPYIEPVGLPTADGYIQARNDSIRAAKNFQVDDVNVSFAVGNNELTQQAIDSGFIENHVKSKERTCRVCSCTEKDCSQCIEKTGSPCSWVEDDLCSACVDRKPEEANEVKNIPSPNNSDMKFFEQLFELIDGVDINITAARKNGLITLRVLPKTTDTISPAQITGTPEELDEGFFDAIRIPIQRAKGLVIELDELHKSLESAKRVKEAQVKIAATPAEKKTEPKAEGKPAPKKTPVKKTVSKKKEEPVPDMFS